MAASQFSLNRDTSGIRLTVTLNYTYHVMRDDDGNAPFCDVIGVCYVTRAITWRQLDTKVRQAFVVSVETLYVTSFNRDVLIFSLFVGVLFKNRSRRSLGSRFRHCDVIHSRRGVTGDWSGDSGAPAVRLHRWKCRQHLIRYSRCVLNSLLVAARILLENFTIGNVTNNGHKRH